MTRATIVEHPKCGRTFLHCLLDKVNVHVRKTHAGSAAIGRHLACNQIDRLDPDIILDRSNRENVIFLCRNPLDVMVSFYYQVKYRIRWRQRRRDLVIVQDACTSIDSFVRSEFGIEYLCRFYQQWDNIDCVFYVKFEDLVHDTDKEFRRILRYLSVKVSDKDIRSTIMYNTFDKLQKRELKRRGKRNINTLKFRKGKVDGWQDSIKDETLNFCRDVIHKYPSSLSDAYML